MAGGFKSGLHRKCPIKSKFSACKDFRLSLHLHANHDALILKFNAFEFFPRVSFRAILHESGLPNQIVRKSGNVSVAATKHGIQVMSRKNYYHSAK
jgi:hypothetical protein